MTDTAAARLQARPGPVLHRSVDGRDDRAEDAVDAARLGDELGAPVIVEAEGEAGGASGALDGPQGLAVEREAVVREQQPPEPIAQLQRAAEIAAPELAGIVPVPGQVAAQRGRVAVDLASVLHVQRVDEGLDELEPSRRRRYSFVFVRLPQTVMWHQVPERLRDASQKTQ